MSAWPSPEGVRLALGALFLLAYLAWTASSSGDLFSLSKTEPWPSSWGGKLSYYGLLAEGLLEGHLHLPLAPPTELLALPNPYDPEANTPYRLHDATLYEGRYYIQWGPVPAVLVYLPLQAIGIYPSDVLVAVIFAFVGSCFAVASLRLLIHRFVPESPAWMSWLGYLALVTGSALPFTLRRVDVYEISILAAYCFAWAGIWFLLKGLLDRPTRVGFLTLTSLSFGLAIGSRNTMLLLVIPLLVAVIFLLRHGRKGICQSLRLVTIILGPLLFVIVLLALYNYLRFDSVVEFGSSFQLAGVDVTERTFGSLSYIPPGSWYYLYANADISAVFPFFHLTSYAASYPFPLPPGYDGFEQMAGIFPSVPITLLTLFSIVVIWTRYRVLGVVSLSFFLLALALVLLSAYAVWGVTMRYVVDFASLFIVSAVLVWVMGASLIEKRSLRILIKAGGSAAIIWGLVFGVTTGLTGYHNTLKLYQPRTWDSLDSATAALGVQIARLQGSDPQLTNISPSAALVEDLNPAAPTDPISIRVSTLPTGMDVANGRAGPPSAVEVIAGRAGPVTLQAVNVVNEDTIGEELIPMLTIVSSDAGETWSGPADTLRSGGVTIELREGRNTLLLSSPTTPLFIEKLQLDAVDR